MPLVKYMQFRKIWQPTFRCIGKTFWSIIFLLLCNLKNVINRVLVSSSHILHRYANEDVSLGSWFIGLDVQHIDERSLCCGTPPGELLEM